MNAATIAPGRTPTHRLTPIQRANRLRWAAIELGNRARELVNDGEITRGFRHHRASERCHVLASKALYSAA